MKFTERKLGRSGLDKASIPGNKPCKSEAVQTASHEIVADDTYLVNGLIDKMRGMREDIRKDIVLHLLAKLDAQELDTVVKEHCAKQDESSEG